MAAPTKWLQSWQQSTEADMLSGFPTETLCGPDRARSRMRGSRRGTHPMPTCVPGQANACGQLTVSHSWGRGPPWGHRAALRPPDTSAGQERCDVGNVKGEDALLTRKPQNEEESIKTSFAPQHPKQATNKNAPPYPWPKLFMDIMGEFSRVLPEAHRLSH